MDYGKNRNDKTSLIYRLRKVSAINATLILFFCWLFLFSTSILFIKRYEVRNLELISTILSSSLTASVVFEDSHDATIKIAQSGVRGMFSCAVLTTDKNTVIAEWGNKTENEKERDKLIRKWIFSAPLVKNIVHANKVVGHLTITGNVNAVVDYIKYSIIILLTGMVFVISASAFVSQRLHKGIVYSLRHITCLIHNIIKSGDFSRRIPPIELKELNDLSNDINLLLSEIQLLQSTLLSENQTLADKVLKDPLTGIYNRSAFIIHLQQLISKAESEKFILLFIDSDRFKYINDNWGHGVGDEVLKTVSQRLSLFEGENDMVARLGGDEFAMLMTNLTTESQVLTLIKDITTEISRPVILHNDVNIHTSVTIGYTWSRSSDTEKDIIERADMNMYKNKKHKRGFQ